MDQDKISYWEKRKAQRMFEYMQSAEDTADLLSKSYLKATGYINHQLDEVYDRFRAKHNLSNAEAKRLLNLIDDKSSYDELLKALKGNLDSEEKRELLKLIESPAYSARIRRLQEIQQELDVLMKQQYLIEKDRTTRHYTNLINESYYKSIYDIQKDTGLAFSFSNLSPSKIDEVLKSKWIGANYSQRIWNNTSKLAQEIKEELLINLLTGRTNEEVANIIANKFATGAMEARRLVRTESCYIANEMEQVSYEECDIKWYRFIATLDIKTSQTCREHDMKRYLVSKRQPSVNCPPMHAWCRSTTIADINNGVIDSLTRRARDHETGKLYKVPGNLSYEQWYNKYVANNPMAKATEKSYPHSKADKAQFEKYRNIYDAKEFESFESFINMKYNKVDKWSEFKTSKQSAINAMPFDDMNGLVGKLGNQETRLWYKSKDENIINVIDKKASLKEQAIQAHALRNTYRTQARDLMSDQGARKILDERYPNLSFDSLVERKEKKYGLSGDEVYSDIIRSSGTTNKKFDKIAGVRE